LEKVCSSRRKLRCWWGAGQICLHDLARGGHPKVDEDEDGDVEDEEEDDGDGDDEDEEEDGNGKGSSWSYCCLRSGHDLCNFWFCVPVVLDNVLNIINVKVCVTG